MAAVLTENPVQVRPGRNAPAPGSARRLTTPTLNVDEIVTELGIWLSGIESFIAAGHHSFSEGRDSKLDASKEFRLVHSTLQRCAMLNARLLSANGGSAGFQAAITWEISVGELNEMSSVLRDAMRISESLINSHTSNSGEWNAMCSLLSSRFSTTPAVSKLIRLAEVEGDKHLPAALHDLLSNEGHLGNEHAELAMVLPRFARILKWLSIVGKMLKADEPLKPALLIFSRVNEQIFDLTTYIDNRLECFPNEEAELFASLDAASYTASIELKKVYSQELVGLARLRPTPSIYARMETAHSLLNEGFQQILAGFARLIDPKADIFKLFPNFQIKFDQSIVLRKEIRLLVNVVQAAEKNPEKRQVETLQKELREFMKGTVRFLFYKDTETVERFVEEIRVTKQNKDLVPILHRFGAYLETLFGQVNLRAVLERHPFRPV